MVNGEYYEKVNQYAVRIAANVQENLIGSGIILPRRMGEAPLLMTAAHVIYPLFQNVNTSILCLGCLDGNDSVQTIEMNVYLVREQGQANGMEGEVYIHPGYLGNCETR